MQGNQYRLTNGMSSGLGSMDILSQDFSRLQNHSNPYPATNGNYGGESNPGFKSAFAGMALEHQASGAELPPPSGFEERVNMLSAGSAGKASSLSRTKCTLPVLLKTFFCGLQEPPVLREYRYSIVSSVPYIIDYI